MIFASLSAISDRKAKSFLTSTIETRPPKDKTKLAASHRRITSPLSNTKSLGALALPGPSGHHGDGQVAQVLPGNSSPSSTQGRHQDATVIAVGGSGSSAVLASRCC
jgi:hypothetical protein